ncbi:hypothetical protein C9F11_33555 [Streptomyces sp. YIM 121038]|nr:hypothetical protein C9F11_33555 [Streptomyces sp. YIM 121038]
MAPLLCHHGVMNFTPYVDDFRHGFVVTADAGGEGGWPPGGERRTAPDSSAPHAEDLAWHHRPSEPPPGTPPRGIPLGLLSAALSGGYIRLQLSSPSDLDTAAALFDCAVPDHEVLALQVPGDGTAATLRAVLGVLDEAGIEITAITVHSPGLGEVVSTFLDPEDPGR